MHTVTEDIVGLCQHAELLLRCLVIGIVVRMELEGKFSVSVNMQEMSCWHVYHDTSGIYNPCIIVPSPWIATLDVLFTSQKPGCIL